MDPHTGKPQARASGRNPSSSGRSPTASGRTPSASGGAPAPSGSGRRVASGSGSARGSSVSQSRRAAQRGGFPMELVIAGAVLLVLGIACAIFYSIRTRERNRADRIKEAAQRLEEANLERAREAFMRAMLKGVAFVKGTTPTVTDDELFAPFKNDPKIFNVVFDRQYTTAKRAQASHDSRILYQDRMGYQKSTRTLTVKPEITVTFGKADNDEIVIASRFFAAEKDDKVNSGGEITVIVKAVKE